MRQLKIEQKIAYLEILKEELQHLESHQKCYMNYFYDDEGNISYTAPLLDDENKYQFARYRAYEQLIELLLKEVK